ncbi:MAG: hypothetical protein ACRELY_02780, partial [Polyangiaceae bacterium]
MRASNRLSFRGSSSSRLLATRAQNGRSQDRRVETDRRAGDDRRDFPRPEGRRMGGGRRGSDPSEA